MSRVDENYFRYVPVRQRDLDWGLYVTGAGCTAMPAGYESYPLTPHPTTYDFTWRTGRKLPEYTAVYVISGRGEFESTPTGRLEIDAGAMFLLFPDIWHRYRPSPETGWDEYWISFAGDTMDRWVERGFFSPERPLLKVGVEETILSSFRMLLDRLRGEQAGFPHWVAADTMAILAAALATPGSSSADLVTMGPRDVATVADRLVADTLRLIWDQSRSDLTVADLEQQLPITRRQLERRFRDALGRTIHEEILRCRLERARRLLTKTNLSVKEVAAAAGFPSDDNMGRAFRRLEGVSPSEYRHQHRQT